MKLPVRILLALLCTALIIGMPFFLSSPAILYEAEMEFYTDDESGEEDGNDSVDFGRLLFSAAMAEEAEDDWNFTAEDVDIGDPDKLSIPDSWALPVDFSIPPQPDPDAFTEDGYKDQSIRVRVETQQMYGSNVRIAYVEIASPTQIRTATAYGLKSKQTLRVSDMARKNNAVIAMNGDDFIQTESDGSNKKIFEYRQGEVVPKRNRINTNKDTLIIDTNGDFKMFILGKGLDQYRDEHKDEIVNAFCFGPALVMDGEIITHKSYGYNRTGHEPRSAIGQTGHLSYVMVIVEGRGKDTNGVSHEELAQIMLDLGCVQAYNLDGGNTAEMCMPGPDPDSIMFLYNADQTANKERGQSDIIYFATAVPEEERK